MRAILTASAIIGTPAIALCSTVEHLSNLQALAVAIGIGTGATASVPTSVIQRASLNKSHGGLAFSLVSSGFGVGAFISAPCLNYLILSVGWRNAFLAHSALFFVLLITGIALCARAGMPRQSIGTSITEVKQHVAAESAWRLFRTPQYLTLLLVNIACLNTMFILSAHLIPFATDRGIALAEAALALGLVNGISVLGRIGSGLVSDAIGWHKTLGIAVCGTGTGFALLAMANQGCMLFSIVVIYGVCHGARAVGVLGAVGNLFAPRPVGQPIGVMVGIGQVIASAGPYVAGVLYDNTGSYILTFTVLGLAVICLGVVTPRILATSRRQGYHRVRI